MKGHGGGIVPDKSAPAFMTCTFDLFVERSSLSKAAPLRLENRLRDTLCLILLPKPNKLSPWLLARPGTSVPSSWARHTCSLCWENRIESLCIKFNRSLGLAYGQKVGKQWI